MKKLSARWVPRLFTVENKRNHVTDSMAGLALLHQNPSEFLRRYITVDQTSVHLHTSETKEQSKQWTAPGEPVPKKSKTMKSVGKVMGTIFWDANGIIFIDYLEIERTVNGEYYASLLAQLGKEIRKKSFHLAKKKMHLHQDNACMHTCPVTMANKKN